MLLATAIFSCKKDVKQKEETPEQNQGTPPNIPTGSFNPVIFSKSLAKAMESSALQSFLKKEALLQFDNDYDILFQKIKDEVVEGKTVYERLLSVSADKEGLKKEIDQNPLLTIFVPELKNFSAEKWNTSEKPPVVAIRNVEDSKSNRPMYGYTYKEDHVTLSYKDEPTYPTVVLKINERLMLNNEKANKMNNLRDSLQYLSNEVGAFRFLDITFKKEITNKKREARSGYSPSVDPRLSYAYTNNVPCHRDYIYYGIDPAVGIEKGTLNNNYAEFITMFYFNSKAAYEYARDWSEGYLEIFFDIFFVNQTGGVEALRKGFSCSSSSVRWDKDDPDYYGAVFYPTPIEIACWDMQNYGDTWKFKVFEYDPGTETTNTTTVSSNFGSNFELNLNVFKKVGIKFGGSATTTRTNTVTIKTTNNSDDLAETLLDFGVPVMDYLIPVSSPAGWVASYRNISTGFVTFTVETRKRF